MNGIETLSASPAVQATALALVHFLWQGALVGILAGWVLTILEKSKASVRYAVAAGALFLMAALPVATALRLVETAGGPVLAAAIPGPAQEQAFRAAPAAPSGVWQRGRHRRSADRCFLGSSALGSRASPSSPFIT